MKHPIYLFSVLAGFFILSAFTLLPPVGQISGNHQTAMDNKPPSDSLTVRIESGDVKVGESICLPVTVYDFRNILSVQFSVAWDTTALKFQRVENFGMRDIYDNSFGKTMTESGYLAFLWYDQHLLGKSQKDGFGLFDICFEAVGEAGAHSQVEVSDSPTVSEVMSGKAVSLRLHKEHGQVEIVD